jgi:hypothetical protein
MPRWIMINSDGRLRVRWKTVPVKMLKTLPHAPQR